MGNPTKTELQARGPSVAAHSAPRAEHRQGLPLLAGAEDNGWDRQKHGQEQEFWAGCPTPGTRLRYNVGAGSKSLLRDQGRSGT